MEFFRNKPKVKKFREVISRERDALVNGDTDALIEILKHKEKLFDEILKVREGLQASELSQLATYCGDVQKLYASAQAGMSSAHKRIQSLQQQSSNLRTYDAKGRNNSTPSASQEKLV